MPTIKLREETTDDETFLRALYASTRTEEIALLPWPEEQKKAFLAMQFDLQRKHYRENYFDTDFTVILVDNDPAGRWYLHRDSQGFHLIDISLIPRYRNQGVGTHLLKALIAEARTEQKTVRLNVQSVNRAMRLYQRLGFTAIEERGVHYLMEWKESI